MINQPLKLLINFKNALMPLIEAAVSTNSQKFKLVDLLFKKFYAFLYSESEVIISSR